MSWSTLWRNSDYAHQIVHWKIVVRKQWKPFCYKIYYTNLNELCASFVKQATKWHLKSRLTWQTDSMTDLNRICCNNIIFSKTICSQTNFQLMFLLIFYAFFLLINIQNRLDAFFCFEQFFIRPDFYIIAHNSLCYCT